jgi:hypothetical protein
MLHGDDILDEAKSRLGGADVSIDSELLARVVELNDRGVPWHHHMNFPDCVFNRRKGKWAITVESGTGDIAYETYDHEPKEILRDRKIHARGGLYRHEGCRVPLPTPRATSRDRKLPGRPIGPLRSLNRRRRRLSVVPRRRHA